MIRAVIVSATIAVLFCLWQDAPKPIKSVQVDYCWIDYHAAAKDPLGEWHDAWVSGWGPCSLQDKFHNI